MTKNTDWLPGSKQEQLEMSKNWCIILEKKADLWNVPESLVTALNEATNDAASDLAIPPQKRNAAIYARTKSMFRKLKTIMRDIKKRYFYNPPLSDYDMVSLGLKLRDNTPTSVPVPTGQAVASITYPNRIQLMVRIKPAAGTQIEPRAYYGCRIYYGIYPANATLPEDGTELRESFFTRRNRELFTFQPGDAGKIACFCLRYENSKGKAGPWGPMALAIIPM